MAIIGDLGSGLKGIAGDTLGATIGISIRDLIASLWKKGRDEAEKRIEDLIKDNPRADFLYVLLALEPDVAATLWRRHLGAILSGTENTFVRVLGQALPRNAEGLVDMERAKAVFTAIAKMDEPGFCQVLEELNHDPILQHVRHWLGHGKNFAEAILLGIAQAAGAVVGFTNDKAAPWVKDTAWPAMRDGVKTLDRKAEQKAAQMNQTPFGRLANRLFK